MALIRGVLWILFSNILVIVSYLIPSHDSFCDQFTVLRKWWDLVESLLIDIVFSQGGVDCFEVLTNRKKSSEVSTGTRATEARNGGSEIIHVAVVQHPSFNF